MSTYFVVKNCEKSERISHDNKNLICSLAVCTIGGSMAVFHSYYSPLWCAPSIALIFCSIFHSRRIQNIMLVYSLVLVVIAAVYICAERPDEIIFYGEHCVVALGFTCLCNIVALSMQKYQMRVQNLAMQLADSEEKYRQRLEKDALTGVYSRAYMQEMADKIFGCESLSGEIGIGVIDLDDFKHVNDTYGHDKGDVVLQKLGELMNGITGGNIMVGRYGGEEFVVLFSNVSKEEQFEVLDTLRKEFNKSSFTFMKEHMSFSAGLAYCRGNASYEVAFRLADRALYDSKHAGKNTITVKEL